MVRNVSRIDIRASLSRVWKTLTEPALVKRWQYGSDLTSSWQVGTPIRFRTVWQETVFEQWGTVLEYRPPERLSYSLFAPRPGLEDRPENYFTMTYHLSEKAGVVQVDIVQEDGRVGAVQEDEQGGENPILAELKRVAEEGEETMAQPTTTRRVVAGINVTLDGFCDHTYGVVDAALHDHYTDLLRAADTILYGRKTFELMQYWQPFLDKPADGSFEHRFATAIDAIPKVVFSRTLKRLGWNTARLATNDPAVEVAELKRQPGGTILVGSPSLISLLTSRGLVDELQLCVHPVLAGKGLRLFQDLDEPVRLYLNKTQTFGSGAMVLTYAFTPS